MNSLYKAFAEEAERDEELLDVLNYLEDETGIDFEDRIDEIDEMLDAAYSYQAILNKLLNV